ncbi:hypothetical protein T484DRAFT_1917043 [Baffinella frigidus]|nr:hypothetical protein T484DRAFT_1917043 [Cryptophyta sp. CCMP2293]
MALGSGRGRAFELELPSCFDLRVCEMAVAFSSPVSLALLLLTSAVSLVLLVSQVPHLRPLEGSAGAAASRFSALVGSGGIEAVGGGDGGGEGEGMGALGACVVASVGFPTLAEALAAGAILYHLGACEAHISSPSFAFTALLALALAAPLSAASCLALFSSGGGEEGGLSSMAAVPWGYVPLAVAAAALVRMGREVAPAVRLEVCGVRLSSHHFAALFFLQWMYAL